MKEDNEQLRSAEEILQQRDKDGLRKYWIGIYENERKMNVKDVLKAMEEYASQFKSHSPIEQIKKLEDELAQ
jgi:phosphoribosylanthranilate isomerase